MTGTVVSALERGIVVDGAEVRVGVVDKVGATANEVSVVTQENWELIEMDDVGAVAAPAEVKAVELRKGLLGTVLLGIGNGDRGVIEGPEGMLEVGGAVEEGPQSRPNKPQSDDVGVGLPPDEVGVVPEEEVGHGKRPNKPQFEDVAGGGGEVDCPPVGDAGLTVEHNRPNSPQVVDGGGGGDVVGDPVG